MAELFLTWEEAQGKRLPDFCATCGAPATDWENWRICRTPCRMFPEVEAFLDVDVTLPVCPGHRKPSRIPFFRVNAKVAREDGVVLTGVSSGFVEAVLDDREKRKPEPATPAFNDRLEENDSDGRESKTLAYRPNQHPAHVYQSFTGLRHRVALTIPALLLLAPFAAILAFLLWDLLVTIASG